jgi:hypothetical protein
VSACVVQVHFVWKEFRLGDLLRDIVFTTVEGLLSKLPTTEDASWTVSVMQNEWFAAHVMLLLSFLLLFRHALGHAIFHQIKYAFPRGLDALVPDFITQPLFQRQQNRLTHEWDHLRRGLVL